MHLKEGGDRTQNTSVLEYILRVAGLLHVSMKLRYAIVGVGIGAVCPDKS